MRLFVAVVLGGAVGARAHEALERLRTLAPRARWVRPEGVHVTLAFLGAVEPARLAPLQEALSQVAARHPALQLGVAGGGSFGSPARPRVLWAGITGDTEALGTLQADVARSLGPLGFSPEARAFTPHLTLARAKEPRGEPALAEAARALAQEDWGRARVEHLVLFESAGGRYVPRLEAPLQGAGSGG